MVEQVDRDAAAAYARGQQKFSFLWSESGAIKMGSHDDWEIVQAFRDHRIAAEVRGMEAAAKIADNRAKASETAIKHLPDEDKSYLRGSLIASEQIAAKIRAALNGGQHE